jgi:hypothetical protein
MGQAQAVNNNNKIIIIITVNYIKRRYAGTQVIVTLNPQRF